MSKWQPNLYRIFEKERTQPSIDLALRIDKHNPKRIIDIGCGPGNSTNVLKNRWLESEIIGIDSSEAMLEQAKKSYPEMQWICADVTKDLSSLGLFDIVFSNAVIQWIPNQKLLLNNLFKLLNKNGAIAVQVPYVKNMPIHIELNKLVNSPKWKNNFTAIEQNYFMHVADFYYDILDELSTQIELWETDYYHVMNSHEDLIKWYSGSGLRPYLDCFTCEKSKLEFLDDYENSLKQSYKLQKNNKILFPFKRIFFIAYKNN